MDKQTAIKNLEDQIKNMRKMQWNASQMRNAKQYGRLERELESMYRKLDEMKKA